MATVRPATLDDLDLLARIAAEGFYDDPVLSWALPDGERRLAQLTTIFRGLGGDYLPDRGRVLLADEASACFWREPGFDHHAEAEADSGVDPPEHPFSEDELARFAILHAAMHEAHPRERHWYLNVVATLPADRSRGLGAAVLAPVLAEADASGLPCYLESTNPRNRSLYYRCGFEDLGDIDLDGGPSLRQMWRVALSR